MSNLTLQNKVAVITGGNSGIGRAAAARFAAAGARVTITGRNEDRVNTAASELGVSGFGGKLGRVYRESGH